MYFSVNDLSLVVNVLKVLDKRRVDHCLISMEGLAEGQAGARLACGEVDSRTNLSTFLQNENL